ncbi:hypothetical protein EVG20_g7390 [Dentipellis fragilis]|uniref:Uncharacterized protein n=1 Tax=Dentipellis fragilis TaxID=205917 RepID=A0A4Y9YHU4_9AGAM|nr:hypothetical protein EVG20_g7390 [Dentipellis fragilis]
MPLLARVVEELGEGHPAGHIVSAADGRQAKKRTLRRGQRAPLQEAYGTQASGDDPSEGSQPHSLRRSAARTSAAAGAKKAPLTYL